MENIPEPAYACAGSTDRTERCPTPLLAADLNRYVLSQVVSVIITSATRDTLKKAIKDALAEAGGEPEAAEAIFESASFIPEWLLTAEAAPECAAVLTRFINRIRVEPRVAQVEYKIPLPPGLRCPGNWSRTSTCPNPYWPDPELGYSSGRPSA